MAVSIKAKKALVRRLAFPKLPSNLIEALVTLFGLAYTKITEEVVTQAIMTQATTKAPNVNKINFQIL